jgi:hypothetical protein
MPLALTLACLAGCSPANLQETKDAAPATFNQLGFEIIGYEGYQWGKHFAPTYGGAWVWYTLKRVPDNGITYTGALQRWGDEYHNVYMRSLETAHPQSR